MFLKYFTKDFRLPCRALCSCIALAVGMCSSRAAYPTEQVQRRYASVWTGSRTPKQAPPLGERARWWDEARFGMFIHWDCTSVKGGEISWQLIGGQLTNEDYEAMHRRFNPTKFDPAAIARLARRTGMRYVILTTKHHDGYNMFGTKLSDYSVVHSPYGKDVFGMLVKACRKEGLRVGAYYSLPDWHHPDFSTAPANPDTSTGLSPTWKRWFSQVEDPVRWANFRRYMHGQVRELCSNYGGLNILWFDLGGCRRPEVWGSREMVETARSLQPNILINDRSGDSSLGDYGTPEQFVPTRPPSGRWETCMTIGNVWAYDPNDKSPKSVEELIRTLSRTACGGGNLLLNIGPMATGEVPDWQVQRLEGIGRWMAKNSEAIYRTKGGPWIWGPDVRATVRGNVLYLHLLTKPKAPVELTRLTNRVLRARVLATGQKVEVRQEKQKVVLNIPPIAIDPAVTVIKLELEGSPDVDESYEAEADGSFMLSAKRATVHGNQLFYQEQYDDLGAWMRAEDYPSWQIRVDKPGTFEVNIEYGCPPDNGGEYTVDIAKQSLKAKVEITGSWIVYKPHAVGRVHLRAGRHLLAVRPRSLAGVALMNLKRIILKPVPCEPSSARKLSNQRRFDVGGVRINEGHRLAA